MSTPHRFCALDVHGEAKYFTCLHNEYCCNFGCCVHLAFQFYQLWYYWLLLIFLFMICSGASWWYRFCRQNNITNYPSTRATAIYRGRRSLQHISAIAQRQNRRTTIIRNNRNTVCSRSRTQSRSPSQIYMERMWKANGISPPPDYYTAAVVRYHSASELDSRRETQNNVQQAQINSPCPYYQLYGPPPSYDSIIHIQNNTESQPTCSLAVTDERNTIPTQLSSNESMTQVHTNLTEQLIVSVHNTNTYPIAYEHLNQSQNINVVVNNLPDQTSDDDNDDDKNDHNNDENEEIVNAKLLRPTCTQSATSLFEGMQSLARDRDMLFVDDTCSNISNKE